MKTDDLIRALAADTLRPPPLPARLLQWLLPTLGVAVLGIWLTLGFRDDLAAAVITPVSTVRFVLAGLLGLIGLRLSLLLARPDGERRAPLWPLAAVGAGAVTLLCWAVLATPSQDLQAEMMGQTMTACLITIPLLSVLPVGVLHLILRQGATTVPRRAGFVAGLAGAGLSAAIYALHCPEDSPLFYVTWSGLAIMGVAWVSALVGTRSLRW